MGDLPSSSKTDFLIGQDEIDFVCQLNAEKEKKSQCIILNCRELSSGAKFTPPFPLVADGMLYVSGGILAQLAQGPRSHPQNQKIKFLLELRWLGIGLVFLVLLHFWHMEYTEDQVNEYKNE